MKFKPVKNLFKLFFISSLTISSSMAADYHFHEYYYNFDETKHLRATWYDESFVACTTSSPTWLGWSNRKIRLKLEKTGIADGFGERTIYTNDSYGYELFSTEPMPLVVGQSYTLSAEYYGQQPLGGGGCTGINQIRNIGSKEFIYDKHDTIMGFPVDINVHSRKLHHKQTDKCLLPNDFPSAFDTRIGATNCTSNPNLAFEIIDAQTGIDGEIKIKSQLLKQCISPRVETSADGAAVRAGSCLDNHKTVFVMDKVKNPNNGQVIPGQFRLRHKESGTCLYNYDYDNTAHLWSCWDSSNQIFTLDAF